MDFTKAQIQEYKKQYGGVFKYTAKDSKSCILRSPDLKILDACRTISGGSSIKFDEALLNNCWLAGDEELKTVDKYKIGLFDWLGGIIQKIEGELEEL
jgi:hypothetical protein